MSVSVRPQGVRRVAAKAASTALSIFTALLLCSCSKKPIEAAAKPIVVRVKVLAPEPASTALNYSASIEEHQSVDLSFKVSGTVARLLRVAAPTGERDLQEGDPVAKESVLAELDRRDYERDVELAAARVDCAKSEIPRAEANAERWTREYGRLQGLEGSGAVTGKQIDETRSQSRVADADLETARRTLASSEIEWKQAQDRLSDTTLRVPTERACIAQKSIAVGERVAVGARVFRIMDVRTVHVVFGVPDRMLDGSTGGLHVALDQRLPVFVQAYEGERFEGRVTKIAPSADAQTRTFLAEVTLDNASGRLRPGMIATIRVGAECESILLPLTAVQRGARPGETAAYVVTDESGRKVVHRRRIVLGGVYDNQVEVLATGGETKPGDRVVVTNAWRLDEGREVAVLSATENGARR